MEVRRGTKYARAPIRRAKQRPSGIMARRKPDPASHLAGELAVKLTAFVVRAFLCALGASPALAQSVPLVVQDAWIRAAPGADVAAAYLSVHNVTATPVTISSVSSPTAAHVMIHETSVENGQSRMRPHERLVVPAGQTVKLQPGGLHVMLQGLKRPLTVGQQVPLVLVLAGGSTVQVTATVRPLNAE